MTPTPPTQREVLRDHILFAVVGEDFASNAEELEDAQRIADHLIASGWVQWEVAKERCAKVADEDAQKAADQRTRAIKRAKNAELLAAVGYQGDPWLEQAELESIASTARGIAEAIRALTPPKGTEP